MELNWSELLNSEEYLKLFVGLLAMANIFSHLPFFLSVTRSLEPTGSRKVALGASLTFGVLLSAVAVFSSELLGLFNLSIAAFQTAGGILIFLNGLSMLRDPAGGDTGSDSAAGGSFATGVTPLGVPLLAGAGSVSFVMIASTIHPGFNHILVVVVSVIAVALTIFAILSFAGFLGKYLTSNAKLLIGKLMGLIILALGIEYIFHGVAAHFMLPTISH
jgi:multiple antibiotic resistance protein